MQTILAAADVDLPAVQCHNPVNQRGARSCPRVPDPGLEPAEEVQASKLGFVQRLLSGIFVITNKV